MIGEFQLSTREKGTFLTSDGMKENLKTWRLKDQKKNQPETNLIKFHNF